ncbi:glucose 1-dehydrogenase [Cytobacillus solani]|uniref:Gluconate 5-dehydrogenase n=1 Tax=Cytobacillus solani TaxID=1637975 RepID=A0A0Q3TD24_9BACI|nr:glucose 1-dehydrogenase [Cytobacillus solani]KOP80054.1 gluconate 5-dehydrogenase [Bacillus sp. FJAT-21945]KQL21061.1 gluconate 5-dehydrogenase [Cytobacillus solani]USK54312.1 glucose 1-dehydrogenase [Cytobacillus solani]
MDVMDLFHLQNRTAIVTGGGKGLGEQMANALAEAGANVVICSRNLEDCQKISEQLVKKGVQSLAITCDITNQADIQAVIDQTVQHFGTIDILINNSGTSWIAPTLEITADQWDKVMNVNLKGMFLFSQAAGKIMAQQGNGKIINISSITGIKGTNPAFLDAIAYSTSKGAVNALTKDLAIKLAQHNIQVNAIAPGFFPSKKTKAFDQTSHIILKRIPAGRFGTDQDIKGAALFLSSNASDYITGQVLVIDGGLISGI